MRAHPGRVAPTARRTDRLTGHGRALAVGLMSITTAELLGSVVFLLLIDFPPFIVLEGTWCIVAAVALFGRR